MNSKYCINGTEPPRSVEDYQSILTSMGTADITFGCVLIFGAILSTIPQHMKILKTKSAAGLSFLWLFLGCVNQYATVINGVTIHYPQLQACAKLGFLSCSPSLLSLLQLIAFWLFSFPFYWYYLYFTPSDIKKLMSENVIEGRKAAREFLYAKIFFVVEIFFLLISTAMMFGFIAFTGECSTKTFGYGSAMGLISVVITFVQWSPQIYKIIKEKSPGSFSIIMLCIQGPGTLVLLYFLIFVSKDEISTWLSYLCSVIQLFIVLGLLIFYSRKNRIKREELEEDKTDDNSEVSFSPNNSQVYTDVQPLLKRNGAQNKQSQSENNSSTSSLTNEIRNLDDENDDDYNNNEQHPLYLDNYQQYNNI